MSWPLLWALVIASDPAPEPVRVAQLAHSPRWLDFGATQRSRYEQLWNQFRPGAAGDDMGLSLRSTLSLTVRPEPIVAAVELIDSRFYLADADTPLNNALSDPFDILQAWVGADLPTPLRPRARARIRAGRMTMDLGSRRLLARNRFRNTINTFTGVDFSWTGPADARVRAFATMPVERLPSERDALARNAIELDREALGTLFWGLHYESPALEREVRVELYALGLHEWDTPTSATRNRQLVTPGLRVFRPPRPGRLDLELEAIGQSGLSRASATEDDHEDLIHLAVFGHLSFGYTFDVATAPRLVAAYDHASGDVDPDDGIDGRFDPLFGARRFELGPAGLYGALVRSNLASPGIRLELRPHASIDTFVAYRAVWLAEARDAWTGAGLRDRTGSSGTFVGQQLEARVRWQVLPGNADFELGIAHLFLGSFALDAPGSNGPPSPTHVYGQVGWQI